ncbi:MAG: AbrB/MazE/SpoVT family DNA-binding domain-containing protein [Candidatus Devosia phytovorans]|uniref:AbrB/MazE/SpoVT family DNA-binding domain-containing protein n=1 Tax=Candidatus Devosia phytovorans TaxID=3121372 RepID=A0AAJ6B0F8_9HYPH|nr:AbrB/MazE/SpoVT family DNA-binding domain-containing protein [Devosia sp.]WEK05212.1 MAG: AbrB/MazE/SpoVT family DNA-binding domain-containing protein [Devosia sp.]
MSKAKLFWDGRSQAVRLPEEFQFEGQEVDIERVGNTLVLKPVVEQVKADLAEDEWAWLDRLPKGGFDQDFIDATEEEGVQQERPGLDKLFK